jgi:hypothetical protein
MVQVDAMELFEETSSNSDPRNIVLFFLGDPEKNPIDIYRSFLYMLVFDSISIACSWRLVYCTRQWVCDASLRNCRIESTRNIHHLLWLWEYYGNINGSHARHSNLAVKSLCIPTTRIGRSHAGFRSLGSREPGEHSKYTTMYDQRSGHSLELGDSSGFL